MSSPTVALLRKDLPWLLAFLALGGALAAFVFGENGFEGVFVVTGWKFAEELELLLVPCAVLFALVASIGEGLRGTREFLAHRPVKPERVLWTRHLAALSVIGAWVVLGTLWAWIWELWSGAHGACADPSRFGAVAAMGVGFMLDYALVVLGLALPATWIARLFGAAALLFTRYAAQSSLAFLDPSRGACLVAYGLGALLALWLAARCGAHAHDPDRPSPDGTLAGAAAVCTLAAACFGATASTGWHELALDALAKGRPMIARLGESEVGLLARPDEEQLWEVVDADGKGTGRRVPLHGTDHRAAPSPKEADFDALRVPALYPPHAQYLSRAGAPVTRRVQVIDDALRVVDFPAEGERRCWTLPLPAGTTGPGRLTSVEIADGDEEFLFYFAPGNGLWLVADETPPRLVPQSLPNGEPPLKLEWASDESGKSQNLVASASGLWRYHAGAWLLHGPRATPRSRHAVLDDDSLRPEVELTLASGASLRHRYELGTLREKVCAGLAGFATLLRPLPFALLGAATDYSAVAEAYPDEVLLPLDALLGGGYGWLLWLNLALNGVLVLLLVRDLRRRGVGGARVAAWCLAVLAAGVFAGPVLLVLEPRRAWRRPARTASPAPLVVAA